MKIDLVGRHADAVEEMRGTGETFSLTWREGDTAQQRVTLLGHHAAVLDELPRRSHHPSAVVVCDEPGVERYAPSLDPPTPTSSVRSTETRLSVAADHGFP